MKTSDHKKFSRTAGVLAALAVVLTASSCGRSKVDFRRRSDIISTSDMTVAIDALRFQIHYSLSGAGLADDSECMGCTIKTEIKSADGVKLLSSEDILLADGVIALTVFSQDEASKSVMEEEIAISGSLHLPGCAQPMATAKSVFDAGAPGATRASPIGQAPPALPGNIPYKLSTRVADVNASFTRVSPQPDCQAAQ